MSEHIEYPGTLPGKAMASIEGDALTLSNKVVEVTWTTAGETLRLSGAVDHQTGRREQFGGADCFQLLEQTSPTPGHTRIGASDMVLVGPIRSEEMHARPASTRLAERHPGRRLSAQLVTRDGRHRVGWEATLRDGASYVRQRVSVETTVSLAEMDAVVVLRVPIDGLRVAGCVTGSPVTNDTFFMGAESPLAANDVVQQDGATVAVCAIPCVAGLRRGNVFTATAALGVAPHGQMRRAFLCYLERERAQPYRPFLHYNNGSEIGCEYWRRKRAGDDSGAADFRARQESVWLNDIAAFGENLVRSRGTVVDAFAHDFEWDDEDVVWQFHGGYPDGFAPARRAAETYGAQVGVWFSPWGGYPGRKARIEAGKKQGLETSETGLTLAGNRYFARVRNACVNMVERYGVNYFKFDGFGSGNGKSGPEAYVAEVAALLRIIDDIRDVDPSVFVNPSTGSWPSPFWLLSADSIWRQGGDTSSAGTGSDRQRWITYRDAAAYAGIVRRAPLYPLSSLMLHGVFVNNLPLFGNPYDPELSPPTHVNDEIIAEIRSFFGTGTNLQELYVNPELVEDVVWDAIADAAKWARSNAHVLADTHWIGGDPAQGQVYGWAAWTPGKGILTLRNPHDGRATFSLSLRGAFELPDGVSGKHTLDSPWPTGSALAGATVASDEPCSVDLAPFEVLVLEARVPMAQR